MIWANDSALRDAPPTKAPSIFGFSIKAFVLSGLKQDDNDKDEADNDVKTDHKNIHEGFPDS